MKRKIELLAPGGDLDSIKAAIAAGADAVYCGLNKFNARNRATNIEFEDLGGIIGLAHRHGCQVFLTINVVILEHEFRALLKLLNRLVNTAIDGVIIQDLGLAYLLARHFKTLKIHASTQLTTHNQGQIKFLSKLAVTRVNLSRELNIAEIENLTQAGHENNIETEVFVHGSNCIGFSGLCYLASALEGKSGNRGRCSQPCREQYLTTPAGKDFPLNLKDNSAFHDLAALSAAGVDSLKIEGRVKQFHYVYTVVNSWRKLLDDFYLSDKSSADDSDLYLVFNRGFSNAFLAGDINQSMYIDNPRDNSALHFAERKGCSSAEGVEQVKQELYDAKTRIIRHAESEIARLDAAKPHLKIAVAGEVGERLKVAVTTADTCFELSSKTALVSAESGDFNHSKKNRPRRLDYKGLAQRFAAINETEFLLEELECAGLQGEVFLPVKELSSITKHILAALTGAKEPIAPIALPVLKKSDRKITRPALAVLISSIAQLKICAETRADIYFQLPNSFQEQSASFVELFSTNRELTPWFPAVLIGQDYAAALEILQKVRPKRIVTNNTGIAYEAWQQGIPWIAGPQLNTVNSFTLLCLKEHFNCSGAFISNEISQNQIKNIVAPEDFALYYSIYHPIELLTSRQCLFHQIDGCEKSRIDDDCIPNCARSSTITNLKNVPLYVDKAKGCYHRIYNNHNFLNSDIVSDLPEMFSRFFIDLSEVKTETRLERNEGYIIEIFKNLLNGDPAAKAELAEKIRPVTTAQYRKGI